MRLVSRELLIRCGILGILIARILSCRATTIPTCHPLIQREGLQSRIIQTKTAQLEHASEALAN
ncbi:MAG: hypothetical protein DI584_10645 [Stenotrophomonas sp.]|nr:MAG: hypothetical protein DI584_10645 [Stenotrophomonas sp.]